MRFRKPTILATAILSLVPEQLLAQVHIDRQPIPVPPERKQNQIPLPLPPNQEPLSIPEPELVRPEFSDSSRTNTEELGSLKAPAFKFGTSTSNERRLPNSLRQHASPQTILVKSFVFKGNTVLRTQELEKIVAPYLNREISINQLQEVRAAVTNFYIKKGYINSGAFFPLRDNQAIKVNDGVITIQIIEGKAGIVIHGASRLHRYIRSHLKKAVSPLNNDRLLKQLQILQADPLIERITAELKPSGDPTRAVLNVQVVAKRTIQTQVVLDNDRSPASGSFERALELVINNPLGLGDALTLAYRNTDGSNAGEAGYSIPVNSHNGTVEFKYLNVSSSITEQPFNRLDILSDTRIYDLTFRQPIIIESNSTGIKQLSLGLTASREESESSLLSVPFPLSQGADAQGVTRLNVVRFFQDWSQRGTQDVFAGHSEFSLGTGIFNSTAQFFLWRGQIQWLKHLGKSNTSLLLRAYLQVSDRPVAALEQFGLGGGSTVRGYRQDIFLTDNGFFGSAELHFPIQAGKNGVLQFIPFFDLGTAWNNGTPSLSNSSQFPTGTLAAIGLGLQYQLGDNFIARIDYGIPLLDANSNYPKRTWQENGVYFNLRFQP